MSATCAATAAATVQVLPSAIEVLLAMPVISGHQCDQLLKWVKVYCVEWLEGVFSTSVSLLSPLNQDRKDRC